ncbi:MAG: DUF368 domain-containing protein [Bacteroidota bacterium]
MKDRLLLVLKGVAMGSADVIPGVSGGTIALITGIYNQLLNSINNVDADALRFLVKGKFASFWHHINGSFLVPVFSGVILAILSFARILTYLLDNYPIPVWSFFFGLILVSVFFVKPRNTNLKQLIFFILAAVSAYLITELTPAETPETLWFVFVSGCIAICAMILPGISGSFLLLLLSKYEYVLQAVKEVNIRVIFIFGLGCLVGILSFSRLVHYLLKNFEVLTLSVLAGFMLGSLNKIWPWKISDGIYDINVFPSSYAQKTGHDPEIFIAVVMFVLGCATVIILERLGSRFGSDEVSTAQ